MLFALEILRVIPALLFNGSVIDVYTPFGIVPITLIVGEIEEIHVPDFHTTLTFQHSQRKVSYMLIDLLDSENINFAPLPLIVQLKISREIEESDVRGLVIGHRGSGSDAYRKENNLPYIPENTMVSFEQAFSAGADWVELDITVTSDGEIVVYHNFKIGNTPVWNMTYAEFKRKAIYQSSFKQIISELDPRIKMIVELKYPSTEEITSQNLGSGPDIDVFIRNLMDTILERQQTRILRFASFEPEILIRLRAADERYDLYLLTEGLPDKYNDQRRNSFGEGIQFCSENDLQGIITDTDTINSNPVELIAAAHEAGLQLLVYWWRTLSDQNAEASEIANLECADVDGFITDNIPLVKNVMDNITECVWTRGGEAP